jgi:L-fucose mutarotase
MMAAVPGDVLDPKVEESYMAAVRVSWPDIAPVERVERFAFYDRAKAAYAVVMTGETAKYGNIILKKGVTAC